MPFFFLRFRATLHGVEDDFRKIAASLFDFYTEISLISQIGQL